MVGYTGSIPFFNLSDSFDCSCNGNSFIKSRFFRGSAGKSALPFMYDRMRLPKRCSKNVGRKMVLLKYFILYLVVINVVAFAMMGIDKRRAIQHKWRIPEAHLFLSAVLGGGLGAILGMRCFHHKTKHWYFVIGMRAIFIVEVAMGIFLVMR